MEKQAFIVSHNTEKSILKSPDFGSCEYKENTLLQDLG